MDTLSKAKRSWNMSQIRSQDTFPEKIVRSAIRRLGYRIQLHVKDLPGRPDIVLPRRNTVVFVHGCFWHRHSRCRFTYTPKTRRTFWLRKFTENRDRDARARRHLRKLGWKVITVWECQTNDVKTLTVRLKRLLSSG
ncbi:MAG: DNA mismatch endonuclease Vsr [Sulfuricaulis sp.]|uniref:very short patch repair endonuclease n=1 Tax=Sulfuricaulis sp. TaxID=2003553 RepID=UPI0025EF532A|nr:DNA mismatch endonuclease Vsr [Sulfuricaulis sp.]MCR4346724.1 DNA mismatch endonuclease Vsr [Sulfuricaulis sp.]